MTRLERIALELREDSYSGAGMLMPADGRLLLSLVQRAEQFVTERRSQRAAYDSSTGLEDAWLADYNSEDKGS